MSSERQEQFLFDEPSRLEADAVGAPGSRRFRLLIEGRPGAACLWMEKEQLQALGLAIDQLVAPLATLWDRTANPTVESTRAGDFPENPAIELQVGRLALGFNEEDKHFIVLVHDAEADPEGPATLTCRATRAQLRALSQAITALVSAGRPRCPLCGQPLGDGPHSCPGTNGHSVKP